MAEITMFMLSESINNVQIGDNFVPQLTSPRVVLRPKEIPGEISFGIAVGITGLDTSVDNDISFTITNPQKEVSPSAKATLRKSEDQSVPKEFQGFMLCADIRKFRISTSGIYKFTLYINENKTGEQTIPVYKGE